MAFASPDREAFRALNEAAHAARLPGRLCPASCRGFLKQQRRSA